MVPPQESSFLCNVCTKAKKTEEKAAPNKQRWVLWVWAEIQEKCERNGMSSNT